MKPVVLISTYALGHMPHGLVSPAAWLRREGFTVHTFDLAVEQLDESRVAEAGVIGLFVPMHTATRLSLKVLQTIRQINPRVPVVFYGLYAPLNSELLKHQGVQAAFGGEHEAALVDFCRRANGRTAEEIAFESHISTERLAFPVPDRNGLPPLTQYATLLQEGHPPRAAGYVLTTRGCKHHCRHCPVVPVYRGRFRVVPRDVVLADIKQLVQLGATHITFGDPDFLNGPGHVLPIVREMHARYPHVTYDVTIKIEHLLRYAHLLPELKATGCVLITTAVESVDDAVLAILAKGHTRADFYRAAALVRENGIALQPTFIPFHPWTTIESYLDLLYSIAELGLVVAVPPVQLAIRLLLPPGSLLLERPEIRPFITGFDPQRLSYLWENPNPQVEDLYREVMALISQRSSCQSQRLPIFREVWEMANRRASRPRPLPDPLPLPEEMPPYLSENWYCCAEPTESQFEQV